LALTEQTNNQTNKQTNKQNKKQASKQANKHKQTKKQNKQTNKQTKNTYKQTKPGNKLKYIHSFNSFIYLSIHSPSHLLISICLIIHFTITVQLTDLLNNNGRLSIRFSNLASLNSKSISSDKEKLDAASYYFCYIIDCALSMTDNTRQGLVRKLINSY